MRVDVADIGKRESRRPSVRAAVIGRINFELAARGSLDSVRHGLGDMTFVVVRPLADSAACDTNGPGDGRPVPLEVRKHGRLKHAEQSTAC